MRLFTPITFSALVLLTLPFGAHAQSAFAAEPIVLDGYYQRHIVKPNALEQPVVFNNLIPGEQYNLVALQDNNGGACVPLISTVDQGLESFGFGPSPQQMKFVATSKSHTFLLRYDCLWEEGNAPEHFISIACETCKKKDLQDYVDASMATLEVEGGFTAETLVREVLIGGNCFDITNVTFSGQGGQIGKFSNGITNIGFGNGVIMATGDISVAPGPNNSDNASAGYGNSTGDADLSQLSGSGSIFDLCNIEFDFTPTQSPLTFEYVFASEEYCEYVGSQFNDAFGFFISGPGLSGPFGGAQNLAVIPGTNTNVAINNVNHQLNAGLYVNNTGPSGILCGQSPSFGPGVNEVEYDGYTRKLVAVANVIPCETYHIKLKIADVGDGIYDSAVFLRAGSFDGGGNASVEFEVNGDPDVDVVYESCGTVRLIFRRVGGNINLPLPVQYTIGGTATPGQDYSPIPPAIVIPAGQSELILTINILNDLILEGPETIIITLSSLCSCLEPQKILTIEDLPVLEALADTVVICGSGVGTLTAFPNGGVAPYTYQWSNGGTDETITAFVGTSTNFRVTVTDDCGKTSVATGRIIVTPPPTAQLLPPAPQICPGQSALININFNGVGPFDLVFTMNGDEQPPIYGITDDPYQMEIFAPGLYQITSVTDSLGCEGTGQGVLLVTESALDLTGVASNVSCTSSNNGSINTTVTGGQGPFTYTWTGPVNIPNIPDPINLVAGNYNLTVTDFFGCVDTQSFSIIAPNAIIPSIDTALLANCYNPNGGSIDLTVAGGVPGFTYLWSNGFNQQDPQNLAPGTYTVTITDQSNCTVSISATVPGDFEPPLAIANNPGQITCLDSLLLVDGVGSSTGPEFSYNWTAAPGQIEGNNDSLYLTVRSAGNYILVVTDSSNGCTSSDTTTVTSNLTPPVANAGPNATITCAQPAPGLNGSGSSQGPNFTYFWTGSNGGMIGSGDSTLTPSASSTGLYTLVVTNTVNGCTKSDTVSVGINIQAPNALVAPPDLFTCTSTSVTLNGSGSTPSGQLTYQWSTLNGVIESGQNSANAVVSSTGDYTLLVTNTQNGCVDSVTVSVLPDNSIPTVTAAVQGLITCAVQEVTIDGTGSSAGPNFSYLWTTTNGSILSGADSLIMGAGAPGQYTLVVTNNLNSCTTSYTVDVLADLQPPFADAGTGQTLSCITPTLTLDGSNSSAGAGYTYSWTASNGGHILSDPNSLFPTIDAPGTYTIVVTNLSNGCTDAADVEILQSADVPVVNAGSAPPITCIVDSVILNGVGSATGPTITYLWTASSGGNILSGANSLTPVVNQPGVYTLMVTNAANNCSDTDTVVVDLDMLPPPADAGPDQTLTCTAPSLNLQGSIASAGNFAIVWQGQNGGNIIGDNTILTPTIDAGGTYVMTVTNLFNGCTSVVSVDVNVDQTDPVAAIASPDVLTCTDEQVSLNATASSTGNMDYQWTTGTGNIVDESNPLLPIINEPGVYTLLVTDLDNGCTNSYSVEVTQDVQAPVAQAGSDGLLTCSETSIQLDGSGSSQGVNIFTYQWDGPGILTGGTTLTPTVNAGGTYTLTVLNQTNGCTSTDAVFVQLDNLAPVAAVANPGALTCIETQQVLNGTGSTGGPNIQYNWTTTNGNILGSNTANQATVNAPGTYNLLVTNIQNGCTSQVSVTVNQDVNYPTAEAGPSFLLTCTVESVNLAGSGSTGPNFNYSWTTQSGNIVSGVNTLSPVVNKAGDYQLLITDISNGCTQTDIVQVTQEVNVPTNFTLNLDPPSCLDNDGTITFGQVQGGYGPYLYSIDGGANFYPGIDFTAIAPGTYSLMIQDANGCEFQKPLVVPQAPDPIVTINPEVYITLGDSIRLTALLPPGYPLNLIDTITWDPLEGLTFPGSDLLSLLRPTARPFRTTEYTVTVISGEGCKAEDRVIVRVDTEPHIYIPNAFSPWDADGENDKVYIFADDVQVLEIKSFRIFDRWGEMVFEDYNFQPNDPAHGWDGYLRGKLLTPAVFVYVAEVLLVDGRIILYKGDVTIVR